MNSRAKGKRGEREFAAFLRVHGFDARRGQQFAGGTESPDVVSSSLAWLHIEVKRVQQLNLAEACAQARRDAGGKPWIVAHRRNREPWFITMDSDELYRLMRGALPFFDLWPFGGPRPITMDAEVFFQFLRRHLTGENRGNGGRTADNADGTPLGQMATGARGATRPTTDNFGKSSGEAPGVAGKVPAVPNDRAKE